MIFSPQKVPDEFYRMVLGPYLKYSSGFWPKPETTLEESEVIMLEMYCERAGLQDGMRIIDLGTTVKQLIATKNINILIKSSLGCGWGSVTLYLAQKYPNSKITSISNSNSQRVI